MKMIALFAPIILVAALFVSLCIGTVSAMAWTDGTVDAVYPVDGFTSLALHKSGDPRISYFDGTDYLRYAAWTGTPGSEWDIQYVDTAGGYSSLVLDRYGYPRISYDDGLGSLKYAAWTGTVGSEWEFYTVDTSWGHSSLVLDNGDNPRISYDDGSGSLKYAIWTGTPDSEWDIQTLDSVQGFSSLALDDADSPRVSYTGSGGDLKYAFEKDSYWFFETVDSGSYWYPSLALDPVTGNPRISYTSSEGDLRYAFWTGTPGSEWEIQTVDTGIHGSSSLALDPVTGNPRVSYIDNSYALMYAIWTGLDWDKMYVDAGDQGSSSLALDPETGNPRVSYFHSSGLKYVYGSNQPPIVELTANTMSGEAPLMVSFDLSSAEDWDGTIVAVTLEYGDGNSDTGPIVPTTPVGHEYTTVGTYTAVYTVTDNDGGTARDSIEITVLPPANQPPVAGLSADPISGEAPLMVRFDLTAAGDPDGTIVSYTLDYDDGSSDTGTTIPTTSVAHEYATAGTYTAVYTVADNDGATDSDSIEISVLQPANQPPVASLFANPISGKAPLTVSFDLSTALDPDGTIVSYTLDYGDGSSDTGTKIPTTPVDYKYTTAGTYTVVYTVTDNDGATASDSIEILVHSPNLSDGVALLWGAIVDLQDQLTTYLANLQTDVTKIKTITETINYKLDSPPEPTLYVYYTGVMRSPDALSTFQTYEVLTNWGDVPAEVTWTRYLQTTSEPWHQDSTTTYTLEPGESKWCNPTIVHSPGNLYKVKITTNSPFVAPTARLMDGSGRIVQEYLPGDFLTEEIYS